MRVEDRAPSIDSDRRVANWLLICAAMVFLIVVIGGITRVTESGLSITEWRPVSGVLPPLNAAEWSAEFAKYQTTTEYQLLNRGMTLEQFRTIFFWEYLHRLWGQLVGLIFALPFFWYLWRGQIQPRLRLRLFGILILIGIQGALGWFMVQSGLTGRTDVSQYRLAAHLSLALFIYALLFWTGIGLRWGKNDTHAASIRMASARRRALLVLILVSTTVVSGAFVAGLNAGTVYNTFPLMGDGVVPPGYLSMKPAHLNFFENPAAVQFNHRLMAVITFCVIMYVFVWSRGRRKSLQSAGLLLPAAARVGFGGTAAVALIQLYLGIATLLSGASISLAISHQIGAVMLLTAALVTVRALR